MAITDNLVAYYKFQGNSTDELGNSSGTDTSVSYDNSYGKIGQGVSFDGSTSKIAVNGLITQLASATTGSISFWAKTIEMSNVQEVVFSLSKSSGTRSEIYIDFDWRTVNKKFHAVCSVDGTQQWDFTFGDLNNYTDGHHFFTVTHNGTTPLLYIDGTPQTPTFTVSTNKTKWFKSIITDATNKANVGRFGLINIVGGDYDPYKGYLDECGIWTKELTSTEVTTLYNSGSGLTYPFTATNIKKVNNVAYANIKKINGVAIANVKKINNVA